MLPFWWNKDEYNNKGPDQSLKVIKRIIRSVITVTAWEIISYRNATRDNAVRACGSGELCCKRLRWPIDVWFTMNGDRAGHEGVGWKTPCVVDDILIYSVIRPGRRKSFPRPSAVTYTKYLPWRADAWFEPTMRSSSFDALGDQLSDLRSTLWRES